MTEPSIPSVGPRGTIRCAVALVLGLTVLGCEDKPAAATPETRPETEPAGPAAQARQELGQAQGPATTGGAVASEGKAKFEEEAFALELRGPLEAPAGQPVALAVVLSARGIFKVNEEYPIKFKFSQTEGVSPAAPVVRREDGSVDKKHAELPLTVSLEGKGKRDVAGQLSFSVCTEDRCLIEKRDLKVTITAT